MEKRETAWRKLGLLLKRSRETRGWGQAELGRAVGLGGKTPQAVVYRWESGKEAPGDGRISRIALALGLDELYLFQLKYEGTPLEKHLGSPEGREARRELTAMEKFEILFSENNVSQELRDRCWEVCRIIVTGGSLSDDAN